MATDYKAAAAAIAAKYNIPPEIFIAQIARESSWNPNAKGDGGKAVGLGQLHRAAVADVGGDYVLAERDPLANLDYAARYLAMMKKKFGNWKDALRGYNAGPGAAAADPNVGNGYANEILIAAHTDNSTGAAPGLELPSIASLPPTREEEIADAERRAGNKERWDSFLSGKIWKDWLGITTDNIIVILMILIIVVFFVLGIKSSSADLLGQ